MLMAAWNERGFMERQRLAVGFKTPAPHDIKHSGGSQVKTGWIVPRDGAQPGISGGTRPLLETTDIMGLLVVSGHGYSPRGEG